MIQPERPVKRDECDFCPVSIHLEKIVENLLYSFYEKLEDEADFVPILLSNLDMSLV
jgi:hypothetical protein